MTRNNDGCCEQNVIRRQEPMDEQPDREIANNKAREIHIKPLNYGYLIDIGCQTFAIENSDKLTKYLSLYLKSPQETETLWLDGKLKFE